MATKKTSKAPKGFSVVSSGGGQWDYKKDKTLQGHIREFGETPSKYKKGEMQKNATIVTTDGEVLKVYERAGLRDLFALKKGTEIFVTYDGVLKIKGRKEPMQKFTVHAKR